MGVSDHALRMRATRMVQMRGGEEFPTEAYAAYAAGRERRANEADAPLSSASSDPLDDALAEDAVGANHERQDHEDVGREVLGAAAHVGIDVAGRHVLHDAHDETADDGAGDRVEPAQDHHREHLETDQRQVDVHAEHVSAENAAERRHDPGHGPGQAEVTLDVDAHGHGHLLVVGHRTHGHALARLEEEVAEPAEEDQADHAAQELDGRDEERSEDERLVGQRQRQVARALEDAEGPEASQDRRQPDGGHDHRDDETADQLAKHNALEGETE